MSNSVPPSSFTIAVHGAPYGSTAHQHALSFASAALEAGHNIKRVFFYHEAVYVALSSRVPPQDEVDLTLQWQQLANAYGLELAVCIANGLKRGLLTDAEANRYEKDQGTIAPGFELVGLGQLVEAIAQSDRYIEFPA